MTDQTTPFHSFPHLTKEQRREHLASGKHEWGLGWAGWRNGLPEWFQTCKVCGKDRVMPR